MHRRLRIAGATGLALLAAACSRGGPAAGEGGDLGSEKIACALGHDAKFTTVCGLERAERGGEQLYVVHHPDGAFRSFTVLAHGAGLAAADGAEPATQSVAGDLLEVAVGGDRYRFPIKLKPAGATGGTR